MAGRVQGVSDAKSAVCSISFQRQEGRGLVRAVVDEPGPGPGILPLRGIVPTDADGAREGPVVEADRAEYLDVGRGLLGADELVRGRLLVPDRSGEEQPEREGRVPKAFASRPATPRAATGVVPTNPTPPAAPGASGRTSITINGQPIEIDLNGGAAQAGPGQVIVIGPNSQQLPPEVLKRLEEMRARGLPIPQLDQPGLGVGGSVTVAPGGTTQSFSKSFSFSLGTSTGGSSSSVASDESGTVSLEEKDGKKHATIKDTSGKVVFEGEVTTPEQRAAMPEEARRRLKLVEGNGFSIPGFNGPGAAPKADGSAKGGSAPAPEKPKKKRDAKEGA